mmetsp:Transcript_44583/g.117814  ORF Transcript_44583/g.117814 Transcript_44583/m.117814 type:complete len:89 (+) Transcript_44583:283-549(+)
MPIMSSAPAAEAPPHALADDEPEAVLECERLLLSSPPPSPPLSVIIFETLTHGSPNRQEVGTVLDARLCVTERSPGRRGATLQPPFGV